MAEGVYKVTEQFEEPSANTRGLPTRSRWTIAATPVPRAHMERYSRQGDRDSARTYPSVPCEILTPAGRVRFLPSERDDDHGSLSLLGTQVWDSALRFTAGMYVPGRLMCLSFTGPYKHLKLSKGGAILTDNRDAYEWFKRFSFQRQAGVQLPPRQPRPARLELLHDAGNRHAGSPHDGAILWP